MFHGRFHPRPAPDERTQNAVRFLLATSFTDLAVTGKLIQVFQSSAQRQQSSWNNTLFEEVRQNCGRDVTLDQNSIWKVPACSNAHAVPDDKQVLLPLKFEPRRRTATSASLRGQGQIFGMSTWQDHNMQIINPAYVGVKSDLSISLLSRQQWVGLEGAPSTSTFSINGRTSRGLGIGTTIVHDRIGLSETTNLNLDGSYTIITSRYSRLSFGLKAGVTFFNNNLFNGITPDNDIYNSISGRFPNVGFGTFFYNRKFFVGFSIPYLLETPQFYIKKIIEKVLLLQI